MTSERALERLLAIEQSGVLDRDDDRKAAYLDMDEVIRDYLGRAVRHRHRRGDHRRAAARAATADPPRPTTAIVGAGSSAATLVKYGGYRATRDEARGDSRARATLVMATTVKPAEEAA